MGHSSRILIQTWVVCPGIGGKQVATALYKGLWANAMNLASILPFSPTGFFTFDTGSGQEKFLFMNFGIHKVFLILRILISFVLKSYFSF